MRKQIKKWGNGSGVFLSKSELELHSLKIGDIIDIGDPIIIKKKKKKL